MLIVNVCLQSKKLLIGLFFPSKLLSKKNGAKADVEASAGALATLVCAVSPPRNAVSPHPTPLADVLGKTGSGKI